MKTLYITPRDLLTIVVISLISVSFFAKGLEFRLKIYETKSIVEQTDLTEFKPHRVFAEFTEVGSYDDYFVAMKEQYKLEDLGFASSEIVAYFNYSPISLDDAFAFMDNRNEQDEKVASTGLMTEQEMEVALQRVQREDFYYTIKIVINDVQSTNVFFDFPKRMNEMISPLGYNKYTYGKFCTLQDAKDVMNMLKEHKLTDVELIAFDNLERIPLASAIEKENRLLQETLAIVK